jgi:tRNA threonylcarbamoyladenosine biosynthesis protein TsaB
MYILAIDTSGRDGSVALASADDQSFEVLEFRQLTGGMYSAELMPQIAALLLSRSLTKDAIDLFSVCSGPGSFTGLRVGLSTAKGLAEVMSKPLVAITVLEAISINARHSDTNPSSVIAALDAQRNEVFASEYQFANGRPTLLSETLSTVNDFTTWLSARNPAPPVFTPDAALERAIRESGTPANPIARPAADTYARIGFHKFLAGETVSPEDLDANYIRRSDAEIFAKPR